MSDSDLRDEVAAHQAECLCHPAVGSRCEDVSCPDDDVNSAVWPARPVPAIDSTGQEWHIDPLCKVRPGRMLTPEMDGAPLFEKPGPVEE